VLQGATWAVADDPVFLSILGPGYTWFDWETRRYDALFIKQLEDLFEGPIDSLPSTSRKPKAFTPPQPGSREFWKHYRESLAQFYVSTRRFTEAVDALANFENELVSSPPIINDAHSAHYELSALAEIAAPAFRFNSEHRRVEEVRKSPGLLPTYALMFMWDRMEGRRALPCQNCDRYFMSDDKRGAIAVRAAGIQRRAGGIERRTTSMNRRVEYGETRTE
jgi:hypothetical protein